MSNIRIDLDTTIFDGQDLVFKSPCDCSEVTGLKIYYPSAEGVMTSQEFQFADAHGNNVGHVDELFAENVLVKIILDTTTNKAFVQNADTNAYLEGKFANLETAYCVECGESGNWYYEKLSNGIIKLYGFEQRTIPVQIDSNQPNEPISRSKDHPFPLPTGLGIKSIFNFVPQANGVDVGVWGGQGYWGGYQDGNPGSLAVFADVFYPTNRVNGMSQIDVNFNLVVVGRWK